jgi:hypothetical protein
MAAMGGASSSGMNLGNVDGDGAGAVGRPKRAAATAAVGRLANLAAGKYVPRFANAGILAAESRASAAKAERDAARKTVKEKMLAVVAIVDRDDISKAYADALAKGNDMRSSNADSVYREQISKAAARLLTLENTKKFDDVKKEVIGLINKKQLGEAAYESKLRAVFASSPSHFDVLQKYMIAENEAKGIASAPIVSADELSDLFGAMGVGGGDDMTNMGGGYRRRRATSRKGSRKAHRKSRKSHRKSQHKSHH